MLVAQVSAIITQLPGGRLTWQSHRFGRRLRNLATRNFSAAKQEIRKFWYGDPPPPPQKNPTKNKTKAFSFLLTGEANLLIDCPLLFRCGSDKLGYLFLRSA